MEMIKARNLTSHFYDEALAEEVHGWIIGKFYPAFAHLVEQLKELEAMLRAPSIRKEERTRLLTNLGAELQGMHSQRIHPTSRS